MIEALAPTPELLHEVRDREARARLELAECGKLRDRMAVAMLLDGSSARLVQDTVRVTFARLAELRRVLTAGGQAPPSAATDKASLILAAAKDTADRAEIAQRTGASLAYVYRVLDQEPPDAVGIGAALGKRVQAAAPGARKIASPVKPARGRAKEA